MALFGKKINWYKLFDSTEAASRMVSVGNVTSIQIGKRNICLAHTIDGLFAMNDKCPHNGASLGNGFCTPEGTVVCPVHRYHFDVRTGRAKSGLGDCMEIYPIEIRENGIFIGFKETICNLF